MHRSGLVAFNEVRHIAVAAEQVRELLPRDPRQYRGTRNLVAIEMQDWEHRAIANGIEKFVRVPAGRHRTGLGFAVTDNARDNQFRIVEGGTVRVCERITELASLVDRAWRFRCRVTRDAARKGELREEPLHALLVPR